VVFKSSEFKSPKPSLKKSLFLSTSQTSSNIQKHREKIPPDPPPLLLPLSQRLTGGPHPSGASPTSHRPLLQPWPARTTIPAPFPIPALLPLPPRVCLQCASTASSPPHLPPPPPHRLHRALMAPRRRSSPTALAVPPPLPSSTNKSPPSSLPKPHHPPLLPARAQRR
jgi:hypothetical protein